MQRSSSAVDFTSLLNSTAPDSSLLRPQRQSVGDLQHTLQQSSGPRSDMEGTTTVTPAEETSRQDLPRPYKCPLCDRAFHRLEHQTRHIRTHTGEKPHPCQYPGCNKRFSRSDELTRHSRIHNNPNSRRNTKAQQVAHSAALAGLQDGSNFYSQAQIMLPPQQIRSAPASQLGSPNVSPPHSYIQHNVHMHSNLSPYRHEEKMDINMLANAASQVERSDQDMARLFPYQHPHHLFSHRNGPSTGRLPSLGAYAISQNMSRSSSQEHHFDDEHRIKRSRPNSPQSTAPPSPTFTHESISPTPDHTPLATPGHSPRIKAHSSDVQLPGLRHLTLAHQPLLAPMEPHADGSYAHPPMPQPVGPSISEIVEGTQRKLPVPQLPKMSMSELLNPQGPSKA